MVSVTVSLTYTMTSFTLVAQGPGSRCLASPALRRPCDRPALPSRDTDPWPSRHQHHDATRIPKIVTRGDPKPTHGMGLRLGDPGRIRPRNVRCVSSVLISGAYSGTIPRAVLSNVSRSLARSTNGSRFQRPARSAALPTLVQEINSCAEDARRMTLLRGSAATGSRNVAS
jgi:hypothetical protein